MPKPLFGAVVPELVVVLFGDVVTPGVVGAKPPVDVFPLFWIVVPEVVPVVGVTLTLSGTPPVPRGGTLLGEIGKPFKGGVTPGAVGVEKLFRSVELPTVFPWEMLELGGLKVGIVELT
jgi:hypothetical protein